MSIAHATQSSVTRRIALIGNPNVGKSTIFNALTGSNVRTGNYPGVTVEHKIGEAQHKDSTLDIIDLPGTYSLAAQSPDELVAVDMLLGQRNDTPAIDGILAVVDASNLQRNLYLISQLSELQLPLVILLNMTDIAQKRGISIDHAALSEALGLPVFPIQANHSDAHAILGKALTALQGAVVANRRHCTLPETLLTAAAQIQTAASHNISTPESLRIVVDTEGAAAQRALENYGITNDSLEQVRNEAGSNMPLAALEASARYQWIRGIIAQCVTKPETAPRTLTDRIDSVLTHKLWGSLSFLAITLILFQSLYAWSGPIMDIVDALFSTLGETIGAHIEHPMWNSLVVDGIIAGVGGVLIFLPQILILFAFIAILEDCGYMARAAFLMDRIFARFGLSGKSFIPLLSSFACAIPGIMAARTIENRRDRLATILVAPLMSCSARLPVYTILIASFVPATAWMGLGLQGLTLFGMHLLGLFVAIPVIFLLKRSILQGPTPAFVMELPSYKRPSATIVAQRVMQKGRTFVIRAGTIIFVMSLVIWALSYFPRPAEIIAEHDAMRSAGTIASELIDHKEASALLEASYLGKMGHAIEPLVRPLGWDWKIGTAAIASFPAREVIVAVLGVLYQLGSDVDDSSISLHTALQQAAWPDGTPVFNLAVALSIMVFFALCCQCGATVATIKRETNSWGWAGFTFGYMTALAYGGAWLVYRIVSTLI